ncbi:MAG: DUF3560 domain-containing protein, partial [Trebonia sp.]
LGCWFVPQSRDHPAKQWIIRDVAQGLRNAGFEVTVSIDTSRRATAEVEADRAERAELRAERQEDLAQRAQERSSAAAVASHRIVNQIPFGQPILVGHHSERRHRRDLARADSLMGRASEESDKAGYHARRAAAAAGDTDRRTNPVTVANRIAKLEAEQRGYRRSLEGRLDWTDGKFGLVKPSPEYAARLLEAITGRQEQLDYWREVRDRQVAAGTATNYGPADIHKGDQVLIGKGARQSWDRVVRANPKTITVQPSTVPFTLKYTYAEVAGVRSHQGEEAR